MTMNLIIKKNLLILENFQILEKNIQYHYKINNNIKIRAIRLLKKSLDLPRYSPVSNFLM